MLTRQLFLSYFPSSIVLYREFRRDSYFFGSIVTYKQLAYYFYLLCFRLVAFLHRMRNIVFLRKTSDKWVTLHTKIKHPRYNIRMYWTNFCQPTVRVQQNIFEQTLIKVGSLNIYASFGIFCVQIGQLFESQCAIEECLKIVKSLFSKEKCRR